MALRSRITSKGQTTIPIKVRNALGLKDGDEVGYVLTDNGVLMIPKTLSVDALADVLGPPPGGLSRIAADPKDAEDEDLLNAIDRAVEDITAVTRGDA
ncbi:MAG: type II toxin-antitoxin system PrlF family antitoxin [Ahrensia sp.]|nr:type II toxin-antitoxin system PrlF family antitoxin [Ahrensia sp.]